MRVSLILLSILLLEACNSQNKLSQKSEANAAEQDWPLLPFTKVDSVNPVLTPDASLVFNCPVLRKAVKW